MSEILTNDEYRKFNDMYLNVSKALNSVSTYQSNNGIVSAELDRVLLHLTEAKYQLKLMEEKMFFSDK